MNDAADAVIIGGGFSGLIAAIHLKELDPSRGVTVLEREERTPPFNSVMILPPLVRRMLRRVAPLNKYKFNEGRFLIFKIADIERDIVIETADTAVANYLDFVQTFYLIAADMGVEIICGQKAERVDTRRKCVELSSGGRIRYSDVIEAAGAGASSRNESILFRHCAADQDIYCYPLECAYTLEKADESAARKVVPDEINLPKPHSAIRVGDMNGYIDHFIDIHTRYTVSSAISAAESVCSGKGAKAYYRGMEGVAGDIKYSLYVRRLVTENSALLRLPEFSGLLSDILLFGAQYKKLYEYLKSGGKRHAR